MLNRPPLERDVPLRRVIEKFDERSYDCCDSNH